MAYRVGGLEHWPQDTEKEEICVAFVLEKFLVLFAGAVSVCECVCVYVSSGKRKEMEREREMNRS